MSTDSFQFTETAIFSRIVLPQDPPSATEAARAILSLGFSPDDRRRMDELAEKARLGVLSEDESAQIANFERVGHYLAILHSKARRSLKNADGK